MWLMLLTWLSWWMQEGQSELKQAFGERLDGAIAVLGTDVKRQVTSPAFDERNIDRWLNRVWPLHVRLCFS